VVEETKPFPRDKANPHGVGFGVSSSAVEVESAFDLDWNTNRSVKLINPDKVHKSSQKPIGYKIHGR
jgi:Cu2+-containing amine oxidase